MFLRDPKERCTRNRTKQPPSLLTSFPVEHAGKAGNPTKDWDRMVMKAQTFFLFLAFAFVFAHARARALFTSVIQA